MALFGVPKVHENDTLKAIKPASSIKHQSHVSAYCMWLKCFRIEVCCESLPKAYSERLLLALQSYILKGPYFCFRFSSLGAAQLTLQTYGRGTIVRSLEDLNDVFNGEKQNDNTEYQFYDFGGKVFL